MWVENSIFREDMEYIANTEFIPWEKFRNSTILVTGATGLLGFNLISALAYVNSYRHIPMKILALVRDKNKAQERFKELLKAGDCLEFIIGDLQSIPVITQHIDYIIHGGSPTASRYFAEHPVETIQINLKGSMTLLEMAKEKQSKGFVFLSSMEVYGGIHQQEKVDESHECFIDTMIPRNSYPEAKRIVESICASYAAEYGVHANVIRLTQTFGAGVRQDDNRVFAQFMRSAMANDDIVLLTKGGTRHSYLYTADAVTAILTVLLTGKAGEAYNAANETTYCSIKEMAELVANLELLKERYNGPVKVRIAESADSSKIYPPELYMDLDTSKIQALNWKCKYSLNDMFTRMMETCE